MLGTQTRTMSGKQVILSGKYSSDISVIGHSFVKYIQPFLIDDDIFALSVPGGKYVHLSENLYRLPKNIKKLYILSGYNDLCNNTVEKVKEYFTYFLEIDTWTRFKKLEVIYLLAVSHSYSTDEYTNNKIDNYNKYLESFNNKRYYNILFKYIPYDLSILDVRNDGLHPNPTGCNKIIKAIKETL
jgi:lysophospholipase L1-like esterase